MNRKNPGLESASGLEDKAFWKKPKVWIVLIASTVLGVAIFSGSERDEVSPAPLDTSTTEATTTTAQAITTVEETTTTTQIPPSCVPLSDDEIRTILGEQNENWTGQGTFTASAGFRAPASEGDIFQWVLYLQGAAPGIEDEVFVFATNIGTLGQDAGLIVGADVPTREFWIWGADAATGSPAALNARNAVRSAERCIE